MNTIRNEIDKTALSYWFPKLVEAGIPVPRTKIIHMPEKAQKVIWEMFDGNESNRGDALEFAAELTTAGAEMGMPFFLRTDHTSAKHGWEDTCFVKSIETTMSHVYNIVEFSEMASIIGLPFDTWAVREFLPTIPVGVCPRYGNMPVCREFRYFVEDGPSGLTGSAAFDPEGSPA
jgi:hypothetical protein